MSRYQQLAQRPAAFTSVASHHGTYRITFRPEPIIAAHLALNLPIPSPAIINARTEAMSYHTSDHADAYATAYAMWKQALMHPECLVAERDVPLQLPRGYVASFIKLCMPQLTAQVSL